ncbi:ABC transporter permease [Clostridium aminobutyricum]|uniref:ABC transporter permease n=1 Tax=Clostridium aminobutyricum TaxID=33953 RepID=A0A939D899_CLOAM|nr:ABC transporter permease [Clostridium aminobutyricum]MBN7773319.1 ABC transporter permease [Clostridium aminobutyricum]
MLLIENIKLALSAIRVNKMRSFLTMLGIIIGISSVIAITSIGDSAKGAVSKEFEGFSSYVYLMINWQMTDGGINESDLFTTDDLEALKERFPEDIRYAVPTSSANSETKIGRLKAKLNISGVGANYNNFNTSINLLYGRFVNKTDVDGRRDSIIIDVEAARYLFNKENVVGETLPVTVLGENKDLTVVGVYEVKKSIFSQLNNSGSYTCYAPYSTLMHPGEGSSYIEIYANENKNQDEQAKAFANYMVKIKDKQPEFYTAESAQSQLSSINQVLGILSLAIGAIAAISLLVGGIGIMNIMLVSVTERTREIGIRKSLGARTNDILTQFLIEAMILSVIGGIIGTGLGIGIATIGMTVAGIDIVINPIVILMAVSFSACVGIFFGIFPARKAAKLDPIEALRFE